MQSCKAASSRGQQNEEQGKNWLGTWAKRQVHYAQPSLPAHIPGTPQASDRSVARRGAAPGCVPGGSSAGGGGNIEAAKGIGGASATAADDATDISTDAGADVAQPPKPAPADKSLFIRSM